MSDSNASFLANARTTALFSIAQKLLQFVLNYLIVSKVSPELLGKVSIRLELVLSTSLFVAREGIRMACLRSSSSTANIVALSWTALPLSVFVNFAIIVLYWTIGFVNAGDANLVLLYLLAIVVENAVEPLFNVYQRAQFVKPKLMGEMIGMLCKTLTTFCAINYFNLGILSFGIAQFVYSITYACVLLAHIKLLHQSHPQFVNMSISPNVAEIAKIESSMISSALVFTGSSVIKHILTESDKIALSLFSSLHDQGVYAFANNYGSIIARILYLPLEDSIRLSLSRVVAQNTQGQAVSPQLKLEIRRIFGTSWQLVFFIGVTIALFGPPFVGVIIQLTMKPQWHSTEIVDSLKLYCYYLFILGINGTSEACLHAIIPEQKVVFVNIGFLFSSIVFFATAYLLDGPTSIVLSNIVATFVRTIWTMYAISQIVDLREVVSGLNYSKKLFSWFAFCFAIHQSLNMWLAWNSTWSESKALSMKYICGGGIIGLSYLFCSFCLAPPPLREVLRGIIRRKND